LLCTSASAPKAWPLLAYRILYSGICRLWTLNVRAFLPKDNPHSFSIASYNYALLTKMLATSSQYGSIIRSSSLVSLFKSWIPRINWVNTTIIVSVPIISMIGMFTTELQRPTLYWSLAYYMFTGIGITAGYHRLWAHKSYDANFITRFVLMLAGSGALQGSIKWWCGGHRVHHRFTDTPKDPYNSHGGFWYAHVGWMLIKPDPANHAKSDIRDLNADPIIRFQHTYYLFVGPFMAFVFPTLVAGLGWGDWMGGQKNKQTNSCTAMQSSRQGSSSDSEHACGILLLGSAASKSECSLFFPFVYFSVFFFSVRLLLRWCLPSLLRSPLYLLRELRCALLRRAHVRRRPHAARPRGDCAADLRRGLPQLPPRIPQ
jgi:hypothetical protein